MSDSDEFDFDVEYSEVESDYSDYSDEDSDLGMGGDDGAGKEQAMKLGHVRFSTLVEKTKLPHCQRLIVRSRIRPIKEQLARDYEKYGRFYMPTPFIYVANYDESVWYLLDGQHRYYALRSLSNKEKEKYGDDFTIPCMVHFVPRKGKDGEEQRKIEKDEMTYLFELLGKQISLSRLEKCQEDRGVQKTALEALEKLRKAFHKEYIFKAKMRPQRPNMCDVSMLKGEMEGMRKYVRQVKGGGEMLFNRMLLLNHYYEKEIKRLQGEGHVFPERVQKGIDVVEKRLTKLYFGVFGDNVWIKDLFKKKEAIDITQYH